MSSRPFSRLAAGTVCLLLVSLNAAANNALRPIGIGSESGTLGGATTAKSLGAASQFSNPAGLMGVADTDIQTFASFSVPITVRHRDSLGNDAKYRYDHEASTAAVAAAHRPQGQPVVLALGYLELNANGNYNDLLTSFGTRDSVSLGIHTRIVTASAAWQITDALALGASAGHIRYRSREASLPDTSFFNVFDPDTSFYGYDTGSLEGSGNLYAVGLTYRTSPDLVIGFSYQSEVDLPLSGNEFVHNQTAVGFGKVTYRDVRLEGARQPREVALGVLARIGDRSRIAASIKQIGWASATGHTELSVSDPDTFTITPRFSIAVETPWRNQNVVALGFERELDDQTTLRLGFNYARQPVVNDALTPTMSPIGERHFTAGIVHRIDRWRLDAGLEYLARKTATYTNANSAYFGGESTEVMEACTIHFGARYVH